MNRRITVMVIVAAAALSLTGCAAGVPIPGVPSGFTLHGTMELDTTSVDSDCQGTDGYDDIFVGTNVTIKDDNDKIVGSGELENGTPTDAGCTYDFSIDVSPRNFYQVEVAHRGSITFTEKEARAGDVGVQLGDSD